MTQRTPTTCSVGIWVPRYFAVASRQANTSTVQHIRPMPVSRMPALLVGGIGQYVARPPEMSNTAPVVNEHSFDAQNATSAAISSTSTKRPRGIFDSM